MKGVYIMKKILLSVCLIALFSISGIAFAVDTGGYVPEGFNLGTAPYMLTVKLSKNVLMSIVVSAPASATEPAVNYVMAAYHSTGSRTFGTTNVDQKIWYTTVTGATDYPTISAASGWQPSWGAWQAL